MGMGVLGTRDSGTFVSSLFLISYVSFPTFDGLP